MGKASKRKGSRIERELVSLHEPLGIPCKRVPLSGAAQGFKGDLWLTLAGQQMTAEVKARANGSGFKTLENWLGENDLLFLRRDRSTPMVLLPWQTYCLLTSTKRTSLVADTAAATIVQTMEEGQAKHGNSWQHRDDHEDILHAQVHLTKLLAGDTTEPHLEHALTRLALVLARKKGITP